ncbi:MAG: hypothetical protein M5U34_44075 [Chloroflexi bacterium]|nr:hypothetical protein [Chloroflexota bacterium]
MRITVPPGHQNPIRHRQPSIFVRDEDETNLAVRDEIVRLVINNLQQQEPAPAELAAPAHYRTAARA